MSHIIAENGVQVQFMDSNYFEFEKCAAHIAIKSKGVKETDVCWFDVKNDTLWLIELKAFDNPANPKYQQQDLTIQERVTHWLDELTAKSIHATAMVLTNRSDTQSCVPHQVTAKTKIKIVHLVKVMKGQDEYLMPMQDVLRRNLQPYSAIFKIDSIAIISYDFAVARKLLSWIV
jgi:hypothetical protein